MATAHSSWIPTQGRHKVDIGTSLGRALKARKAGSAAPVAPKRSNLPDRDFYSFRYNFKPPSIDSTKPGTIEVKRGKDSTSVNVEHPTSQAGEGHVFVGSEQPAKEIDCVLIYDEETGTYTLEKLDSYMVLTYERKTTTTPAAASPIPVPVATKETRSALDLEEELERDLLGLADADGDPEDDFEQVIPKPIAFREEEEEEEEIVIPPRPPSPPKPKPVARPVKPVPKPRQEAPLPPKPKPVPMKLKKIKREPEPVIPTIHFSDADEEDLEFGKPAKRARPSPPSEGLALPGATAAVYTPPPPVQPPSTASRDSFAAGSSRGGISTAPSPPPAPPSESEEEWDEVEPTAEAMIMDDIFGAEGDDNGEEIDVNAFEMELNEQMEESDEDFLAAAVSPEPEAHPRGPPISLNQFAGGEASEDEYSSSDESDDD